MRFARVEKLHKFPYSRGASDGANFEVERLIRGSGPGKKHKRVHVTSISTGKWGKHSPTFGYVHTFAVSSTALLEHA